MQVKLYDLAASKLMKTFEDGQMLKLTHHSVEGKDIAILEEDFATTEILYRLKSILQNKKELKSMHDVACRCGGCEILARDINLLSEISTGVLPI